jgi:RsiW-degrading membrane proteinase PrsW (M82 family)
MKGDSMNKMRLSLAALLLVATIELSAMDTTQHTAIQAAQSVSMVLLSRLPCVIVIAIAVAGYIYGHRKSSGDTSQRG